MYTDTTATPRQSAGQIGERQRRYIRGKAQCKNEGKKGKGKTKGTKEMIPGHGRWVGVNDHLRRSSRSIISPSLFHPVVDALLFFLSL